MSEATEGAIRTAARWTALLAGFTLVTSSLGLGCSSGGLTGLDLAIHMTEVEGLDRVEVTLLREGGELLAGPFSKPEQARPLDEVEGVVVLVSDDLDGETLRVLVEGFSSDVMSARGEEEALVEVGALREVVVTLRSASPCDEGSCPSGEVCLPARGCVSGCLVEGEFYEPGATAAGNSCLVCRPRESTEELTEEPAGTTCGVGMVCDPDANCVHSRLPVSVTVTGEGEGVVASDPSGIDCGFQCGALFDFGSQVVLTAAATDDSSAFVGWSGEACSGSDPVCRFIIQRSTQVVAEFAVGAHELTVHSAGSGDGRVVSDDGAIECGDGVSRCSASFPAGETVLLTASPAGGGVFSGWGGACQGDGPTCEVVMAGERLVTASFDSEPFSLAVVLEGTGEGGVVSEPEGLKCAPICSAVFHNSAVRLTAVAEAGSRLAYWSEDGCGEGRQCEVVMDGDREVTATFGLEWAKVAAGSSHSCGIDTLGRLWCWGRGDRGELGHGRFEDRYTPVQVSGGHADWVYVTAGLNHTCGIRAGVGSSAGSLFCWGVAAEGRLGTGDTSNQASPSLVDEPGVRWSMVSAGQFHTCALGFEEGDEGLAAWCWGRGSLGRLGHGGTTGTPTPVPVHGGHDDWLEVSAGQSHSCGLRSSGSGDGGSLWCWGRAQHGRMGDGQDEVDRLRPHMVTGGAHGWVEVSAGREHSCALHRGGGSGGGSLWCWGNGLDGRLGPGDEESSFVPVEVSGGHTDWLTASAGDFHSCGVRAAGAERSLWCWGRGGFGRLGHGGDESFDEPVEVAGDRTDWRSASAGGAHTCAVRGPASGEDGSAWCWGYGVNGTLGYGGEESREEPNLVR